MLDFAVPITMGNWILAFIPIVILLALLVGFRWGAAEAGALTWFIVVLVAVFAYKTPLNTLALETVKGVWSAVFSILVVVWPAILIYEVTNEAGAFEPFRKGMERVTPNRLLQIMAFAWGFAGFLQGVTGFGVPVAICAPLLVGIGVRPLQAVILALVGTRGTTHSGYRRCMAGSKTIPACAEAHNSPYSGAFIWMFNIVAGLTICWIYGKAKAIKKDFRSSNHFITQGGGTLFYPSGMMW